MAPHLADRARAADPPAPLHRLTVDAALQARVEPLLRRAIADLGPALSAALIVADHRGGEILAHLGSPDVSDPARAGWVDMTAAPRSPGSTLKPLVCGLAFAEGLAHPQTLIEDRPTAFGAYSPANFDGAYLDTISVRTALQSSRNISVIALAEALGPARLIAALDRGARCPARDRWSDARAVDLHWRAGAPAALPGPAVLPPEAAWQVADILRGLPAPPAAPQRRIAFRTGTSYGHRDAWAVGVDGTHVIAVWIGRPDGTPVPGAFGADLATPPRFEAFARLKPAPDPLPPPPPGC